jgi:D-hexose-6-phosphate mutarotase
LATIEEMKESKEKLDEMTAFCETKIATINGLESKIVRAKNYIKAEKEEKRTLQKQLEIVEAEKLSLQSVFDEYKRQTEDINKIRVENEENIKLKKELERQKKVDNLISLNNNNKKTSNMTVNFS